MGRNTACLALLFGFALVGLSLAGNYSPEAIDEPKSVEEENFVGWLKAIGATLKGVDLANFTNPIFHNYKLRGVKATQDIKSGDQILSVPGDMVLSSITALSSPLAPVFKENPQFFTDDQVLLAVFLMFEFQNAAASKWAPHLVVFPIRFHTSCEYSPSELRQLEGSVLHDETIGRQALFQDEFNTLFPFLAQKYPHLLDIEKCTFTFYKYARLIVQTRAFGMHIDGRVVVGIVPFADMLNHNPRAKIAWKFDHTVNVFRMYTEEPYKKGDQVYNNYGPRSNRRLLLDFGFTIDDNPYDFVEVPAPLSTGNSIQKTQILEDRGLDAGKRTFSVRLGEVPEELMFAARVARATSEEVEDYARHLQAMPSSADGRLVPNFNSSISLRDEIAALSWLSDVAQAMLNKYHSTYEEDAALLESGQVLDRAQLNSLIVRFSEKRIYKFLQDFAAVHIPLLDYYNKYATSSALSNSRLSLAAAEYMRNVMLPLHRSMLEKAFEDSQRTAGQGAGTMGAPTAGEKALQYL
eukprot:c11288_g1_i1.p1 GENE.c11288_g1_i1~~c11288_g1_i1.p1  ORF type:complete len:522 (-),score=145.23 c11288_g1_i1:598-2163(-)